MLHCMAHQTVFFQDGWTAFHVAASNGSAKMVAYMMEQVNPNVDARDVVSYSTSRFLWLMVTVPCEIRHFLKTSPILKNGPWPAR